MPFARCSPALWLRLRLGDAHPADHGFRAAHRVCIAFAHRCARRHRRAPDRRRGKGLE